MESCLDLLLDLMHSQGRERDGMLDLLVDAGGTFEEKMELVCGT